MTAPYDVMWNGKTYVMGSKIPTSEKKLIQSLTIAPASTAIEDAIEIIEDDEPAITKPKK